MDKRAVDEKLMLFTPISVKSVFTIFLQGNRICALTLAIEKRVLFKPRFQMCAYVR
jgi:hypothetical protein